MQWQAIFRDMGAQLLVVAALSVGFYGCTGDGESAPAEPIEAGTEGSTPPPAPTEPAPPSAAPSSPPVDNAEAAKSPPPSQGASANQALSPDDLRADEECKKIVKFSQRKACYAKFYSATKKAP